MFDQVAVINNRHPKRMPTEVLFRVDGGEGIGMGHIMEMLHLAEIFHHSSRLKPVFAISKSETAKELVRQKGEEVIDLPGQEAEISFLKEISQTRSINKIVLNLMKIPEGYLHLLKKAQFLIVNIVEGVKDNISDEVIDFTLKPECMILNPVFYHMGKKKEISPNADLILVCFGANDPLGLTLRVTRLLATHLLDKTIYVIIGVLFKYLEELRQLKLSFPNIILFHDIPITTVAEIMQKSSLAVTAGGDMMYELVSTGTPTITICPSERQLIASIPFKQRGIVHCLGLNREVSDSKILTSVKKLSKDSAKRKEMSQRGKKLMDGKGGVRVAEIIYDRFFIL